jgi:hypothetical protein
MNVLLLGLQVKTLVLLFIMAATFSVIGPILVTLINSALDFIAEGIVIGQSRAQ